MDDLSIAFKLNDQILTFWQFYVAWSAGVIGWVFSRERGWALQKRIGIGIGTLTFYIFNISGLYRSSSSLHSIISILKGDQYKIPSKMNMQVFQETLNRLSTGDWYLHIAPHILADFVIFYFIFALAKKDP